jgi:hypothetical protein
MQFDPYICPDGGQLREDFNIVEVIIVGPGCNYKSFQQIVYILLRPVGEFFGQCIPVNQVPDHGETFLKEIIETVFEGCFNDRQDFSAQGDQLMANGPEDPFVGVIEHIDQRGYFGVGHTGN